jgi:DUF438 domain-containing protein
LKTDIPEILPLILDNLKSAVVFVDNEHIIRYLNAAARKKYAKYGEIIGKSIFHCHNENSCRMIRDYHEKMRAGADEFLLAEREAYRAYMRSVRSPEGELLGYYEIHEPK